MAMRIGCFLMPAYFLERVKDRQASCLAYLDN